MKLALHWQILIGMLLGAAIGLPLNVLAERGAIDPEVPRTVAAWGKEVGDVFLRLLSMIVVPLIFGSIVTGVTGTGSLKGLGRMSGWTFCYFIGSSMLAIVTGLVLVNVIQPGRGADLVTLKASAEQQHGVVVPEILQEGASLGEVMWGQVINLIPSNPLAAMADPTNRSVLAVIFFAILFAVFIVKVGGPSARRLTEFFDAFFEVMMALTLFIIRLAPIGVLGFMLYASAGKGLGVFASLGLYMLTVFLGLFVHGVVTLPLILFLLGGRRPVAFTRAMSPALLTAFSTASSNGTLPVTISCADERAGIPNQVASFVLPLGATINMDGTALYEAVAVLFIAQAYGNDLTFAQQAVVAFTALLASLGAAGVPHAGTVMMVVVLGAVGLPLEGVGLILAVDRVLDMCRTTVNVWSDTVNAAVVARFANPAPLPGQHAAIGAAPRD